MASVEQTQNALFRQLDAAAIVAVAVQAAEQSQRQTALETQRLARRQAHQVGAASALDADLPVDQRPPQQDRETGLRGGQGKPQPEEAAGPPGPTGRRLDIIA
jgi:hypothetical protein